MIEATPRALTRICIVGGAGFIGGHFVDRLLRASSTEWVTVYDNFSSGREWHLAHHDGDDRLTVIKADVRDLEELVSAVEPVTTRSSILPRIPTSLAR